MDYAGLARANLAWLAWRIGDLPAVRQEGTVALENWQEAGTVTPFRWLALWPLIGAALKENSLAASLYLCRHAAGRSPAAAAADNP